MPPSKRSTALAISTTAAATLVATSGAAHAGAKLYTEIRFLDCSMAGANTYHESTQTGGYGYRALLVSLDISGSCGLLAKVYQDRRKNGGPIVEQSASGVNIAEARISSTIKYPTWYCYKVLKGRQSSAWLIHNPTGSARYCS